MNGPKFRHQALFGRLSTPLRQICPIGCYKVYCPSGSKIDLFKARSIDIICLYQNSGGIYRVLTEDKILRTKHFRAIKDLFLRLDLFKNDPYGVSTNNEGPERGIHDTRGIVQSSKILEAQTMKTNVKQEKIY